MAATQGVPNRSLWVGGGIAGGALGAVVVAGFAETLRAAMAGIGQEVFNAAILFAAVAMLGWHNVWMRRHAGELAGAANRLGAAVRAGTQPLWALAFAVGLAVLREGSEVVLFLYGIAAAGQDGAGAMALGGALGLVAGVAAGAAIYFGLVHIPMPHLFSVTGWLILLLAAGMASQGAAFLLHVDLLPPLGQSLWDAAALQAEAEDLKIRSPIIEPHELEFENNFVFGHGKTAVHELEYGFIDWLKLGVEAELAADPGHGFRYDSAALEGFLQLTPQGKYWADVG